MVNENGHPLGLSKKKKKNIYQNSKIVLANYAVFLSLFALAPAAAYL